MDENQFTTYLVPGIALIICQKSDCILLAAGEDSVQLHLGEILNVSSVFCKVHLLSFKKTKIDDIFRKSHQVIYKTNA